MISYQKIIHPNNKCFTPELTEFLRKHNMLAKATKYLNDNRNSRIDMFPGPKPNLHLSFLWMDTEEGYMFWKDLSDKFLFKK